MQPHSRFAYFAGRGTMHPSFVNNITHTKEKSQTMRGILAHQRSPGFFRCIIHITPKEHAAHARPQP